jgi:hypothetical protein
MTDAERDHMVLAILDPPDRAKIEAAVDEIIEEELPVADRPHLLAAARSFEERGDTLPIDKKLGAMQLAAALRIRARGGATQH